MNCRYYQELLTDLLAGELTPAQQQQLERHLAECPACAAECRSAREALDAVTPHIDTALPAGFESRLLEAVRRAAPAPERLASQRRRHLLGGGPARGCAYDGAQHPCPCGPQLLPAGHCFDERPEEP